MGLSNFFAHYSILQCSNRVPVIPIHLPIILDEKKYSWQKIQHCQILLVSKCYFTLSASGLFCSIQAWQNRLPLDTVRDWFLARTQGSGSKARVPRHLLFPMEACYFGCWLGKIPHGLYAIVPVLCLNQLKPYYSWYCAGRLAACLATDTLSFVVVTPHAHAQQGVMWLVVACIELYIYVYIYKKISEFFESFTEVHSNTGRLLFEFNRLLYTLAAPEVFVAFANPVCLPSWYRVSIVRNTNFDDRNHIPTV